MTVVHLDRALDERYAPLFDGYDVVGPDDSDLSRVEGALVGGALWDGARMDLAPGLRVLSRMGIGYDGIDLAAATDRGVVVANAPEAPTVSTAEHAVALMMHASKSLAANQRRLRQERGGYGPANEAIELAGKTLGLVGFGRIGARVALVAQALQMNVVVHDPYVASTPAGIVNTTFEGVLAAADVISAHCPLVPETQRLFDENAFNSMRRGVVFINASRGGLVDHAALVAALDNGHVAAAGLDVTEPEPLSADHPLQGRDNVIITPHIASSTDVGRHRLVEHAAMNLRAALSGERLATCVNPAVYQAMGQ